MARTPTRISAFSASLSEPGGRSQMAWERNVDRGGRRRINIASICRRSLLSLRADFYMISAQSPLKCWKYQNMANNGAERKTGRARPEVSLLFMEREGLLSGSLQGEKDWSPHFFFLTRSPRALPKNRLSSTKLLQIFDRKNLHKPLVSSENHSPHSHWYSLKGSSYFIISNEELDVCTLPPPFFHGETSQWTLPFCVQTYKPTHITHITLERGWEKDGILWEEFWTVWDGNSVFCRACFRTLKCESSTIPNKCGVYETQKCT